jgi:hypothetical protein
MTRINRDCACQLRHLAESLMRFRRVATRARGFSRTKPFHEKQKNVR